MKLSKDNNLVDILSAGLFIEVNFTKKILKSIDGYLEKGGFQIYPEKKREGKTDYEQIKRAIESLNKEPLTVVPCPPETMYTPYQRCPVCGGAGKTPLNWLNEQLIAPQCHCCQGSGVIPMKRD
jgi:hypothetical protein